MSASDFVLEMRSHPIGVTLNRVRDAVPPLHALTGEGPNQGYRKAICGAMCVLWGSNLLRFDAEDASACERCARAVAAGAA